MKTTPLSLNSFSKKASVIYFVTTPIYNDFFYLTVVINMLFLVDFICKLQNIELGKNYTHQCIYCYVS